MEPDPIKIWQHIHGASAHFPIALMSMSFLFDLGGVVLRRPAWRTVGFWCLLVAAVVSVPLILSGFTGQLGWFHQDKWEADKMLVHRNVALAAGVLIFILTAWRASRERHHLSGAATPREHEIGMRAGELAAYLVILALSTVAVGYTGWLGAYVARGY